MALMPQFGIILIIDPQVCADYNNVCFYPIRKKNQP